MDGDEQHGRASGARDRCAEDRCVVTFGVAVDADC
jgi:hypothetical protein